jgi:hypothetical protein
VECATPAISVPPRAAAFELAEPVGAERGRWLTPAAAPDTVRRVAAESEALTRA